MKAMETCINEIEHIKIHGRTVKGQDSIPLFWTASGFECNVSGTELWVLIESTYQTYEPWFSYTINGDWIGRQMLPKGKYWIPLFRGMSADKIKNVRFYKDLQAMSADGESMIYIHAFRYDGSFYPVQEKKLKIEFIGDSITSGEGLFGAKEEEDWIPMFFSALKNYSYLTAFALDADYRVFSQSGWGVHNSWDNNPFCAIPDYYNEVCSIMPGEHVKELGGYKKNDFTSWKPDFIVVNLGTNDATSFEQPEWEDPSTGKKHKMIREEDQYKIKESVTAFLKKIRDNNEQACIIWCYGMLGLNMCEVIEAGIAEYKQIYSDDRVHFLILPEVDEQSVGSRQHPGYLCHQKAAQTLIDVITNLSDGCP